VFAIAQAFVRKQHAVANPWGAGATTLEWTLPWPRYSTAMRRCRASNEPFLAARLANLQ
jgi:hypothetical protein